MPSFKPEQSAIVKSACEYDVQFWQVEDLLKKLQKDSENNLNIREISRYKSSEISTGFGAEKGEEIEFDIIFLSDGSSVKANITVKPGPDGGGSGLSFGIDISKIHTPEQAKAAFSQFNEIVLQTLLKLKSAGSDIEMFGEFGPWHDIACQDMKEAVLRHEQDFREKGINTVSMNGQMILDLRLDAEASLDDLKSGEQKRAKPWDVPRGAPDKTR